MSGGYAPFGVALYTIERGRRSQHGRIGHAACTDLHPFWAGCSKAVPDKLALRDLRGAQVMARLIRVLEWRYVGRKKGRCYYSV